MREFDEDSWRLKFNHSMFARLDRLEEAGLTIDELVTEYNHTITEMFTYFLCLEPEEQRLVAPKIKPMLDEFMRREREVARLAKVLIAKQRVA